MNESSARMTQRDNPPSDSEIEGWIGKKAYQYWTRLTRLIGENYPNIFKPEWLFGGMKHGWSLRYKKGKSFCTFVPEKHRALLVIVFGAEERQKVELVKDRLSVQTREKYDQATTYHDGKWLRVTLDSVRVIEDVRLLLAVKRKPKTSKGA